MNERFDRQMALFGEEGQGRLTSTSVAVIGVGGLGTHVIQQLALLGVGKFALVDGENLEQTNRNRYIGVRHTDPIPGTRKVDIGERIINEIDPELPVHKIYDSFISEQAFEAIIGSDYVFGCLDNEGSRLILNELCSAYSRRYVDLASDVIPGKTPAYGGRICVSVDGNGCIICCGLLDQREAQTDLAGPEVRKDRKTIYGVDRDALGRSGPSVVSINGTIASLAVTEFMVHVTGLRAPKRVINYFAHMGRLTLPTDEPLPDCYYCKGIRNKGDAADVQRYIREGTGKFLR